MGFQVDKGLIDAARSDETALNDLLKLVWPEVFRVCAGIVRDRSVAEDAAQEACAAIARSLSGLKSGEAFFGWMYTIAGRAAVEAEKKRRRQSFEALPDQGVFEERDGVIDLRTAIARLTLAQRSTIVLYYYAGLSSAEIGQVLNVPSATVRFHLMLGRRALRRALSDSVSGQEACEHA